MNGTKTLGLPKSTVLGFCTARFLGELFFLDAVVFGFVAIVVGLVFGFAAAVAGLAFGLVGVLFWEEVSVLEFGFGGGSFALAVAPPKEMDIERLETVGRLRSDGRSSFSLFCTATFNEEVLFFSLMGVFILLGNQGLNFSLFLMNRSIQLSYLSTYPLHL